MKKLLSILLVGLLLASGCQPSTQKKTITKTTQGYNGPIEVTVSFDDDEIVNIIAKGDKETVNIGQKALSELPAIITQSNSTNVDNISGATVTSQAIKAAVNAAIAEAQGKSVVLKLIPGNYIGEAYGNISTIKVEVTTTDEVIQNIEIIEQGESPILFEAARDATIRQIIDQQTLAVDSVSGASVTSNAIVLAVKNALESSGSDITPLLIAKDKKIYSPSNIEKEADVVVIGGGGAGLVAAIEAAQQGASVIVIEKAPFLGGNLLVFGGIYNTPDKELQANLEMSDNTTAIIEKALNETPINEIHAQSISNVKADYEKWKNDGSIGLFDSAAWYALQTWNSGDKVANKELVDMMCNNAFEGYRWLEDMGVEFSDKVTQGAGSLYQRTHGAIKPSGSGFIQAYVDTLKKYPDQVTIYTETEATELILENGEVVGVKANDSKGNTYTLKGNNGIVLATGGFAGNVELRQEYCEGEKWVDLSSKVLTTNLNAVTGDGIIMARDISANLIDMEQIQLLHLGNAFSGSTKGVVPYKGRNSDEVIFVNAQGERFVAEDERRDVLCNAILTQEGAYYWMIHDSKNIDPNAASIDELIKGKYLYRADTLEELAELIGIDATTLTSSVNQYNSAVASKTDELTGRKLLVATIDEGPYFAAKRVPSAHHTMGGVEINSNTEVINIHGNIIKGLFAAGEVTGGIHGANRVGGNAVDDTVVFGRIAGKNAASNK